MYEALGKVLWVWSDCILFLAGSVISILLRMHPFPGKVQLGRLTDHSLGKTKGRKGGWKKEELCDKHENTDQEWGQSGTSSYPDIHPFTGPVKVTPTRQPVLKAAPFHSDNWLEEEGKAMEEN